MEKFIIRLRTNGYVQRSMLDVKAIKSIYFI